MTLDQRIESFVTLGEILRRFGPEYDNTSPLIARAAMLASMANPWFTKSSVCSALRILGELLTVDNLNTWISPYRNRLQAGIPERLVGVVAAGNIPAVAFHDLLCVLIAGYRLKLKLSSTDQYLLPSLMAALIQIDKAWEDRVIFSEGLLQPFDAIIATGSDNTSRYFEHYFSRYPNIIRKNRTSAALLAGDESVDQLEALATDIMLYFGMGCRNVTMLLVPAGYDFSDLSNALGSYSEYLDHAKYRNNLDYNRAMFQLNNVPFTDAGTMLITPSDQFRSRISVLHYYTYRHREDALNLLRKNEERLQCIVSVMNGIPDTVVPGKSQKPLPGDYADRIDTMEFLLSLKP